MSAVEKILRGSKGPKFALMREIVRAPRGAIRVMADLPKIIPDSAKRGLLLQILATTGISEAQRDRLLGRVAKDTLIKAARRAFREGIGNLESRACKAFASGGGRGKYSRE